MPRKINKRKAIQDAKRKAQAEEQARNNKCLPKISRVGFIAHYHSPADLAALLLGLGAFPTTVDFGPDVLEVKDE